MKHKKLALFKSAISLVLCISMFVSTTFAWFTDEVVSGGNIIASGKLDATMEYATALDGQWTDASTGAIFNYEYWEPGYTDMKFVRIGNNGNLAFRYQLHIIPTNPTPEGEPNLADVIDVYYAEVTDGFVVPEDFSENMTGMTKVGTLSDLIGDVDGAAHGVLLPTSGSANVTLNPDDIAIAKTGSTTACIMLHMQEDAGNEYQNLTVGGSFRVQLLATQYTYENDSFGNDYDTDAGFAFPDNTISENVTVDVTVENNQVKDGVTIQGTNASAQVPSGVQVSEGTDKLTLTITEKDESESNVTLGENEAMRALDVHVDGVAAGNTQPMEIYIKEAAPKGLNAGNLKLYHVENGVSNAMTAVDTFTAHNQFKYDPATGDVTLYMATFSEITCVVDTLNPWLGTVATAFAGGSGTEKDPYIIANADQLVYFGKVVGGMDGNERKSFDGEFVKLISDINLGDKESENNPDLIFHPIGYYYNGDSAAPSSTVYSFQGTFDGAGHTIANFYQNTWEIKGDYDANYYKDGMGLFGYVYGGTVKNLTVDHFSSDGEFTPTGVIAAYADGDAKFENIAITNCNPRVYNTGNGGIIGIAGDTSTANDDHIKLTNITVDNSNKISALWGSWDVACGGLVGMYRGNVDANGTATGDTISFTNCHVAAQIDVYNDVCANYQYYAYRYAGMIIGSVRHNTTSEGKTIPNMTGISASGCTVHFGTWNDYYYCELVDNTTASYTHDYQMSRLVEVKEINGTTVTYLDGTTGTVPASGRANYVVVDYTKGHGTANATCHHFKDGAVWTHDMGGIQTGIDEDGDGQDDLKEDKQHLYLEFNNLFTGYGWGVSSMGIDKWNGIAKLDVAVGNQDKSVQKFEVVDPLPEITAGSPVSVGDLFKAIDGASINSSAVQVAVTALSNSGITATYVADTSNWENGTLTFDKTDGMAKVTIQDYNFCEPTSFILKDGKLHDIEKFAIVFPNVDKYLYRVGNINTVPLNCLFKETGEADVDDAKVNVTISNGGTYTSDSTTWENGTLNFSGYTGLTTVTISEEDAFEKTLYLEVVDAVNATSATSATAQNVVLLNDVDGAGNIKITNKYTFYGNGFTLTYTGDGAYGSKDMKRGFIEIETGGELENTRIVCKVFPESYIYTSELTATPYKYQYSAVMITGDSRISNCYIYGARNNICIGAGNVIISDTITECGSLANIQIDKNATSDYTVILNNVTTIQHCVSDSFDAGKTVMGAGVMVGTNESNSNPVIHLTGAFKQYNWVTSDDADVVSNSTAKSIINAALNSSSYVHEINGVNSANLGIIYLNTLTASVINDTGLPYSTSQIQMSVSGANVTGQVCSLQNATANQIYSDYTNADNATVNGYYEPQFRFDDDLGGQLVEETTDCDAFCYQEAGTIKILFPEGETKELDLAGLVNISKYTGQNLNLAITCEDSNGNAITVNGGKITLSEKMDYVVTYAVTDTLFYDKNGQTVQNQKNYAWSIPITVSLKDKGLPNAYYNFDATKQVIYYNGSTTLKNIVQFIPFLAGLEIYDYEENGTEYLRFAGSDTENGYNKIASVSIENKNTSGEAQGNHIVTVDLLDGGKIIVDMDVRADSGGSTHSGSIKVADNVVYVVNNGTTGAKGQTWKIYSYKFTGNNGVEIDSGLITFGKSGTDATSMSTPTATFGEENTEDTCVTSDTLVTLADGTQKRIDKLSYDDELLVWDFYNGEYTAAPISIIHAHEEQVQPVLHLNFSDGTTVKVISSHGFFDTAANNFVYISEDNATDFVGHKFIKANGGTYVEVTLESFAIINELTTAYWVQTAVHNNAITEGMLSITTPDYEGWFDYFNITDDMQYDEEHMRTEIEKYGLFTYEELAEYGTYEQFVALNGQYMKILIGRGVVTMEDIIELLEMYA